MKKYHSSNHNDDSRPVPLVARPSRSVFGRHAVDPESGTQYASASGQDSQHETMRHFDSMIPSARFRQEMVKAFQKMDYELIQELGEGGMGTVYEGRYKSDSGAFGISYGTRVAIKLLSEKLVTDDETRTRFLREASIVSAIDHPNFVKIYEVGEVMKRPFFAMEYLDGKDLGTIMDESPEKKVSIKTALCIIYQVCCALAFTHSRGVVHRDLKPENIFVVRDGDDEIVKVIDLGIAKLLNKSSHGAPRLTDGIVMLGTPVYMAPETIPDSENSPVYDHRIDIYSIGITLYELISGRVPFETGSYMGTIFLHKTRDPDSVRAFAPEVPESVEKIIMRCLAKDPDDRFQTAQELLEAIEATGIVDKKLQVIASSPDKKHNSKEHGSAKGKSRKWLVYSSIAAGLAGSGVLASHYLPVEKTGYEGIYKARIEADIPNVSVVAEETLPDGTMFLRELGKTPLDFPTEGQKTIYLEHAGYQRSYVLVSPENKLVRERMKKRD
ncbi:serine/threonine protein kinase [Candidatus Micrarchaeota archaeon]|nr:serine/threonine protein kinase [Candidatus Micrarchaeota archaeon]